MHLKAFPVVFDVGALARLAQIYRHLEHLPADEVDVFWMFFVLLHIGTIKN